jgi:phage shock protein C
MSRGKLTKSSTDKVLAGVCGGIAAYFDLDPVLVRVGYVLLSFLVAGFPGLLAYIVLAIMMPADF